MVVVGTIYSRVNKVMTQLKADSELMRLEVVLEPTPLMVDLETILSGVVRAATHFNRALVEGL